MRKLATLHKHRCRHEEAHETCFLSEEGGSACRGFVQTVIAETSLSNHDVKLDGGGTELAEFSLRPGGGRSSRQIISFKKWDIGGI